MRGMKITLIVLAVILIAVIGYVSAGGYNIAADEPHWKVTSSLLAFVRERSIDAHAKNVEVPKDLDNPARIARGAGMYDEMCVSCHLAPGITNTELRKGLYPQPPALASHLHPDLKEVFYIISHGIKMTAMPAWGKSHTPDQIWDMVAFLQKLPELTPEQYKTMTADTDPHSHGHEHDHGHEKSQIRCGGDG